MNAEESISPELWSVEAEVSTKVVFSYFQRQQHNRALLIAEADIPGMKPPEDNQPHPSK